MSAITHGFLTFRQPSAHPERAAASRPNLGRRIAGTMRTWRRRLQDRQALLQLTHRDMRDIGVTPSDISWETSQPFWRAAPPR